MPSQAHNRARAGARQDLIDEARRIRGFIRVAEEAGAELVGILDASRAQFVE